MNGNYKENSNDYSTDTYGQSKRIGELVISDSLVIRTSTIGHEIFYKNGLLEWFLSNKSECKGYQNAFFNGLTTLELSKIIYKYFIKRLFFPKSIINIGGYKISKYDLLCKINRIYDLNIDIQKDVNFKIDRTLDISKFLNLTDYKLKTWYRMLKENKNY
jgi:dTDP-4-dehydrorhamnose reductase